MKKYEDLVMLYEKEVDIYECDLYANTGNFGMYRNGTIFIESSLTEAEKKVILVEEYNHHLTTYGNILNQSNRSNVKQENLARKLTIEQLLPPKDLKKCFYDGYTQPWEIADHLGLPEYFVKDSFTYFQESLAI